LQTVRLRYNDSMGGVPNNNTPAIAVEPQRRGIERRKRVLWSLVYGSFNPRRRGSRRAGENLITAVDWHHPQWLAIGVLIVACSCADALLTLMLMSNGAYELNPFMASLIGGSAERFAFVKIAMTAGGVVLLTQLSRVRTFGRIPVGLILYGVLALYGTLILYELRLLKLL
jgi:Domain of unknown function (DUF5658)